MDCTKDSVLSLQRAALCPRAGYGARWQQSLFGCCNTPAIAAASMCSFARYMLWLSMGFTSMHVNQQRLIDALLTCVRSLAKWATANFANAGPVMWLDLGGPWLWFTCSIMRLAWVAGCASLAAVPCLSITHLHVLFPEESWAVVMLAATCTLVPVLSAGELAWSSMHIRCMWQHMLSHNHSSPALCWLAALLADQWMRARERYDIWDDDHARGVQECFITGCWAEISDCNPECMMACCCGPCTFMQLAAEIRVRTYVASDAHCHVMHFIWYQQLMTASLLCYLHAH